MKLNLKFSIKFYWGAILVVISFILGMVTKLVFFYPPVTYNTRMSMAVIYLISWPMLFLGVYWMGKEYADSLRKYMQYRYYHKYVKAGTKKAYHATKEKTIKIRTKAKERTTKLREKTKAGKNKIKNKLKKRKR